MDVSKPISTLVVATSLIMLSGFQAHAGRAPVGVWIDHTGRGAVEITKCGSRLCGHVVWVKSGKNKSVCGRQIIGNARHIKGSTWDKGWIYSPERKRRYNVEIRKVSASKLRVHGYKGSKFFGKTMTWKKAPAGLVKCFEPNGAKAITAKAAPEKAAPKKADSVKPATVAKAEAPKIDAASVAASARAEARIERVKPVRPVNDEPAKATPSDAETAAVPSAAVDDGLEPDVRDDTNVDPSPTATEDDHDDVYAENDEDTNVDEKLSARDILEGLGRFAEKISEKRESGEKCAYNLPYVTLRLPCVD